jgi:hypothetical protein
MSTDLQLVPQGEQLPARTNTALIDSSAIFDGGLKMDRVLSRRLLRQLEKQAAAGPVPPGLVCLCSQLRSVLARRGWKSYYMSAQSPDHLRRFGPTLGGLQ